MNTILKPKGTLPYVEAEAFETNCQAELNAGMTNALKQMNIEVPVSQSPRARSTEVMNRLIRSDRSRIMQLMSTLWMTDSDLIEANSEIEDTGNILNPDQIRRSVTGPLFRAFAEGREADAQSILDKWPVDGDCPVGYIAHMDEMSGGHGDASAEVIMRALKANRLQLSPDKFTAAEVGAGPGKISWRLIQEGLIPNLDTSRLELIDPRATWLEYAKKLLSETIAVRLYAGGAESYQTPDPIDLTYSALCLQWITGDGLLEEIIRNMKKQMSPGAVWLDAGEMPEDVFGTTPQALVKGLEIGFEGAYSFKDMAEIFERVGFQAAPQLALRRLAMPDQSKERLASLTEDERKITSLASAMNEHIVIGSAWINS